MDKTPAQKLADKRLDEAIARTIEAYGLLPAEPTALDVVKAFHEIASGIVGAAIEEMEGQWADS